MRIFGLIGYPLKHSFSEKYFSEKFKCEKINDAKYFLFPLNDIGDFHSLIQRFEFAGMNVTIPFKQSIIEHLDEIDGEAGIVGAVNTIKFIKKDNKLTTKGYNSDVFGFEMLLDNFSLPGNIRALILGTGGSSKAVAYVLAKKKIPFSFVSRNPVNADIISYRSLSGQMLAEHKLIINATPLGMFPEIEKFPDIPYDSVSGDHICIDLIYNPAKTTFMMKCEQRQAAVLNGMDMLVAQAEQAWDIWKK